MLSKVCVFFKCTVFASILLLALVCFSSCSNLFGDIKVPSADGNTVTITGAVGDSQGQASRNGRVALPSVDSERTRYTVSATDSDEAVTIPGEVDVTNNTFSIALPLGKVWTITLVMEVSESQVTPIPESSFNKVLEGTYTFDHALTADDVTTPVYIVLEPVSGELGSINLPMSVASGVSVSTVVVSGLSESAETLTLSDGVYIINKTDFPCGAYVVTIDFKNSAGLIL